MPKQDKGLGKTHPPAKRERIQVGALDTLATVRAELGRLYRASRQGAGAHPTASDAARLGYLLHSIGRSIVDEDVVRRIEALEAARR